MPPAIEFACPQCGHVTRVPPTLAGKQGRCGGCRRVLEVPVGLEPRPSGRATAQAGPLLPYSGEGPVAPRPSTRAPAAPGTARTSRRATAAGDPPPAPAAERAPAAAQDDDGPPDADATGETTGAVPAPPPPRPPAPRPLHGLGAAVAALAAAALLRLLGAPAFDALVLGLTGAVVAFVAVGWRPPWRVTLGVGLAVLVPALGLAVCLLNRRAAREAGCEGVATAGVALGAGLFLLNLGAFALGVLGRPS